MLKNTNSKVSKNRSLQGIRLIITFMSVTVLLMAGSAGIHDGFSQSASSDTSSTTPLKELNTEAFSQVVVTSTQINELNNTANNALKSAEGGNMTQVLLQLKILINQIDLLSNP